MHLWHVSARSRRLDLASSLRTSRRGLSAQCVSRPRYTRYFSGLFFAPVGHRLNVLVRRRAPAALSIACPLSSCIWPIMDHVAVWCGLTPSTIGDCFSSPVSGAKKKWYPAVLPLLPMKVELIRWPCSCLKQFKEKNCRVY